MGPAEQKINKEGLQDVIKLHGWMSKSDVIKMLDNSHILLAPSVTASNGDQEGIPVAMMEAMAMGLPLISSYHSGIPELFFL